MAEAATVAAPESNSTKRTMKTFPQGHAPRVKPPVTDPKNRQTVGVYSYAEVPSKHSRLIYENVISDTDKPRHQRATKKASAESQRGLYEFEDGLGTGVASSPHQNYEFDKSLNGLADSTLEQSEAEYLPYLKGAEYSYALPDKRKTLVNVLTMLIVD